MKYIYDRFESSYNYQYMLDTHGQGVKNEILLDMPPAKEFRVNIAYFPPGTSASPHSHDWEHFIYILKGRGIMVVEDEEGPIRKGTVIFIPPDAVHSIRNTGRGELVTFGVHGPPKTAKGFAQLKRVK